MNKTVIKLDGVTKRFNVYSKNIQRVLGIIFGKEPAEVRQALTDISLRIERGERVAIMGPVNAGRTTLLNIISGVIYPTKGKVKTVGKSNVFLNAKAGTDAEFTCRENIYMKANVVGVSKDTIRQHEDEIIEFAEVADYADLPLKRAPKGTLQLLALAVHLMSDADILLLDDVFGGGGRDVKVKCENKISSYLAENEAITAVIVTSRPSFAKKNCTRGLVIDGGKIIFDGDISLAVKTMKGEKIGISEEVEELEELDVLDVQ